LACGVQHDSFDHHGPAQTPLAQMSGHVHGEPSLHGLVLFVYKQPEAGTHESLVHTLPSLQTTGSPTQMPPTHLSADVHALLSLHAAELGRCRHWPPRSWLQVSSVHGLLSLQSLGLPVHFPARHASSTVHTFWSLHSLVLFVKTHPEAGTHASSVHGLLSTHTSDPAPTHFPPAHTSFNVQASLSLHGIVLFW